MIDRYIEDTERETAETERRQREETETKRRQI